MAIVFAQTFALCFAGFLLWWLWRECSLYPLALRRVVGVGFLMRAFGAAFFFWTSYLHLPLGRRLQLGDGFWFFGLDGKSYIDVASHLAAAGPKAIVTSTNSMPSVAYVRTVATLMLVLGVVTAVGLLLNLLCYLATCLMLMRWGVAAAGERATLYALAFLALSPSAVLWSLQPLKDAFFVFLIIAFLVACRAWQNSWRRPQSTRLAALSGLVMAVVLFNIAGVRWYYAFVLFICSAVFLGLVIVATSGRRAVTLGASILLLLVLGVGFLDGAGPYVPASIRNAMLPSTFMNDGAHLPQMLLHNVEEARSGFQAVGGATTIAVGRNLAGSVRVARVETPVYRDLNSDFAKPQTPGAAAASAESAPTKSAATERAHRDAASARESGTTPGLSTPASAHTRNGVSQPPRKDVSISQPQQTAKSESQLPQNEGAAGRQRSEQSNGVSSVVSASAATGKTQVVPKAADTQVVSPTAGIGHGRNIGSGAESLPKPDAAVAPRASGHLETAHNVTSYGDSRAIAASSTKPGGDSHAAAKSSSVEAAQPKSASRAISHAPAESVEQVPPQITRREDVAAPASRVSGTVEHPAEPEAASTAVARSAGGPVPATATSIPVARTASAPVRERQPTPDETIPSQAVLMPQSVSGRLLVGAAAILLPRNIAQGLGILDIKGGRGLWVFADVDTIVFDIAAVAAVVAIVRRRSALIPSNGVAWLVLLTTLLITVPLVYTVTNFGTLFRLRQMIFVGLVLAPMALAAKIGRTFSDASQRGDAAEPAVTIDAA